jgi:hypothetical protein
MTKKTKVISAVVVSVLLCFFLWVLIIFLYVKISPLENGSAHLGSPLQNVSKEISVIDKILERLELGNIAFNAPKKMNMEEKEIVTLLLSATTPTEVLKSELKSEGEKVGATIRISDRMEARLSGQNFTITAITPEIQAVSRKENTEWKWEVAPKEKGDQFLHLTLSALILVDGASTPKAIRTFDSTINVEVTPLQRIKIFVTNNWQWLWATILVPIGGWLWKKRKNTKK